MRLYRVIVPVPNIDQAAAYYESLLGLPGKRVSSGRHYLDCEGTILALFSPREDTDPFEPRSNQGHLYLAVDGLSAKAGQHQSRNSSRPSHGVRSIYFSQSMSRSTKVSLTGSAPYFLAGSLSMLSFSKRPFSEISSILKP